MTYHPRAHAPPQKEGVKKFENGRLCMPETVENAGAAVGHFQFFHTF
jgi:hypothetical protein